MSDTRGVSPESTIEAQAAEVHAYAAALFVASEHRFGTSMPSGEETYDVRPADKVRHRAGNRLITFAPYELFNLDENFSLEGAPIDVLVDEPLPATPAWPNTYIRQIFTLGPADLLLGDGAFDYRVGVDERASDGRVIIPRDSVGLMVEGSASEPRQNDLIGELERLLEDPDSRRSNARKLAAMHRLFPDIMERFQPARAATNFQAVVPQVLSLSRATEVGCQPNPYIRRV